VWLVFVFNPEYFGSVLSVTFPSAPYPLSSICCSYQKEERANPGNLPKSNAFSDVVEYLVEKYFHFLHIFFSHTSSTYPLLGLFCLLTRMDTYTLSRTFRDEVSTRPRDLLPDKTQYSQETNIHSAGGIRIHNPSKIAATELRRRPHGHREFFSPVENVNIL